MKVIVFGGSGFLGSHVADILDTAGYDVTIYDLYPSQYIRKSQNMIVGDILDEKKVTHAVSGCDIVYNFAGISDIEEASRKALESVKTNILGNSIILEACRKAHIKRFVFASSLYVYSKAGSFYRSTKQACELLTENYQESFGLKYTILRYGSLYGPRASDNNFIHKVIKQAISEGKISRYGNGKELREYIHVQDAAKGSVDILAEEFANQHIVLTGNQQMRVEDLLNMIKEIFNNKVYIGFFSPDTNSHYEITPYTFAPKTGRRLMGSTYMDLNEGLLQMIYDLHGKLNPSSVYYNIQVKRG